MKHLRIASLAWSLPFIIYAASDTIPLNKKTPSVKTVDPSSNDITTQLKKSSGQKKEAVLGSEEAGQPKPYLASVSVFGTKRVNEVILRETLGKDFDRWIKMGLKGDEKSTALEDQLSEKMKAKFGFPFAEFSVVQFFEPGDYAIHICLDVVEKADMAKRMNFLTPPTEQFQDPDNLIKQWIEYENTALDLVESGQLDPESSKCIALHCPFGHEHEKLKKFGPIFAEGVKKHLAKLLEIQAKDRRPEFRAAATYLLPYATDGNKIISGLVERIRDPDAIVRNNAMRVLGDIAEFHPDLVIPIKPLIEALNFPKASDRSKSIYVAYLMSLNSESAREELLKSAVPSLLDLLASKLPDQKEFSHGTLRKLSGKDFPVADLASWRNWYAKLSRERGVSGK